MTQEKQSEKDVSKDDDGVFSERLRKLRNERGWTLESLSYRTGLSCPTLSKMENGANPKLDSVVKLADALDVSIDHLAGRSELSLQDMMDATGLDKKSISNVVSVSKGQDLWDSDICRRYQKISDKEEFLPERSVVNKMLNLTSMLNQIRDYYGPTKFEGFKFSDKTLELCEKYSDFEETHKILMEKNSVEFHRSLDMIVLDKILGDWTLIKLIGDYIRSCDMDTPSEMEQTHYEIDAIVEKKIWNYIQNLRKTYLSDPEVCVLQYPEEDQNRINELYLSIPSKDRDRLKEEHMKRTSDELIRTVQLDEYLSRLERDT